MEFIKDPNASLDYHVDWLAWLAGDTIVTSTWTVPAGITQLSESETTTMATIWLSGGTLSLKYNVVNRIVTAGGRTDDRTLVMWIQEK